MNQKDQEAINHIASVSNHPHAEIICKWLITGWDVKWCDMVTKNPTWHPAETYKLIETKPAKPAYRVYVDSDGDTFTADRLPNGAIVQTFQNDITWISDWIEYDPPKKWPTPLVERIAAIDIKAAEWIVEHWDDLLEGRYTNKGMYDRESHLLSHCFNWHESDIDSNIWENISTKLGE